MSLVWIVAGCADHRAVTVRVRPPALDAGAGDAAAAPVTARLFAPGERCVVLGVAPLGGSDEPARVSAVRASAVVASDAPSCFGASGAVLLDGLLASASYLVEMVVLEPDGGRYALELDRERIVSLQDLPLPSNAEPTYICLSDPHADRVWPPILEAAVAACAAAPLRGPCTIPMPYGGVCPIGSR